MGTHDDDDDDDQTEWCKLKIVLQSPHRAVNCFSHIVIRSSGQGAIMCKSRATHWVLINNMSCTTWYKETAQLSSLTELKLHSS